ncbi:hypothetical protein J6590_079602 [Homalodisca vitripennis]|nr:hypothetical protein J6590_079602 [Homalodisca vitripennis]
MDFTVEKTTAGKPCILFKNYKYRQQRTLKSGDINWRCLTGKNCGASIKTDANVTNLSIVNDKHTGAHAVTMRQMKSPGPAQSTSLSTLPPAACSTPSSSVPQQNVRHSLSPATANFSPLASTASTSSSAAVHSNAAVTPTQPATPTPSNKSTCLAEMQAENSSLRTQVAELRKQLQDVLDHTIESARRLLQFTDELFVVNPSRNKTPSTSSSVADTIPIEPGEQRSTECKNRQCTEVRDLVSSLKTTIEVLEAEIEQLKSRSSSCPCKEVKEENSTQWTVCRRNKKNQPIKIQNKYDILTETPEILKNNTPKTSTFKKSIVKKHEKNQNKHKRLKKQPKQKTLNTETSVTPVVFSTVIVEGDSHVRSLAGLVQSLVTAETSVLGVCKPGAGLFGVVGGGQPPLPGNCYVLIAGANDVGAGESSTIFEHLEHQIIVRTSIAKVVVSTVPYRHDLSTDHPVNKQTTLVNHYIRELCARCEGSVLLDFNTIGRRHFTRHGQHLTMGGKRLLARLVVANLRRASLVSVGPSQPPPPLPLPSPAAPAESPSIAAAEPQSPPTLSPGSTADTAVLCVPHGPTTPWTLPHDSYAEAVRSSPPNERRTSDENTKSKAVF